MDLFQKFLNRLDKKRKIAIQNVMEKIHAGDFANLDVKKLKGEDNVYRVRKGRIRIKFTIKPTGTVEFIDVDFRDDNTY